MSRQANNEMQTTVHFLFWATMCTAKPTLKQIKSLSIEVFSQLLINVILPVSSHFPQEIAYSCLYLINTLFHEKQTAPTLSITKAKYNLKTISIALLAQLP